MPDRAHPVGATWLDGEAWRDDQSAPDVARVLFDRGLLLGDGLFETVAVRYNRPVLFQEHLERLDASAAALCFPLPTAFRELALEALRGLIDLIPDHRLCALRITVTRGVGTEFGLDPPPDPAPTTLIRLTPVPDNYHEREKGWIVDWPRAQPDDPLAGHKTTSSMWRIMAHQEARQNGADLAIIPTVDGDIAEAATASIFVVVNGITVTPPLSRGILAGTVRAFCLKELDKSRRSFAERILLREEIEAASEVFVTSSVSSIRPLGAVQGRPLPEAAPVADWLRDLYESLPGEDIQG